jgi:succinate dehydrogenase/fumarate reductase flavoprotein subunit
VPHGDPILQWLVCDGIDAASAWLFSLGVRAGPEESFFAVGRGWRIEPVQALNVLAERFRTLGGTLLTSHALEALASRATGVQGVRCTTAHGSLDIPADAVVLATGGFQGNAELVTRYVVRDATHLALRASPWSTGDGLLAAIDIGAAHSPGLDKFYGHALCAVPEREAAADFRALSQFYGPWSVALDVNGRRFCDESDGAAEEVLNYRLAHQPQGRGWYVIDKAMLAMRPMPGLDLVTSAIVERARAAGASVVEGASVEALGAALARHGVPGAVACGELVRFNAAMIDGADDLVPPRRANRRPLVPPLYAVPVQASITFTMGGLAVDERARVLRRAGSSAIGRRVPAERAHAGTAEAPFEIDAYREATIPGLYAAGCDVGNVHHRGYLGALASGLVIGRVAGQQAAGFAQRAVRA